MASPSTDDSDEFFWQCGGNGENDNAEEHVREADFVDEVGGCVGEDVAAEDDDNETENEVANVVQDAVLVGSASRCLGGECSRVLPRPGVLLSRIRESTIDLEY